MDAAGLRVTGYRAIGPETDADELIEALGLPLVINPRRDSGGRAQVKLSSRESVAAALTERARDGSGQVAESWIAERWIDGREMSVEAFVRDGDVVFVNPTEYYVLRHANVVPGELEAPLADEVRALLQSAVTAAGVEWQPATGVSVSWSRDGELTKLGAMTSSRSRTTAADGSFEFGMLNSGTYVLRAAPQSRAAGDRSLWATSLSPTVRRPMALSCACVKAVR